MANLTPKETERLHRLIERSEYLGERIEEGKRKFGNAATHRDRAEKSALDWAIKFINETEDYED